jgi:hypothetical protein
MTTTSCRFFCCLENVIIYEQREVCVIRRISASPVYLTVSVRTFREVSCYYAKVGTLTEMGPTFSLSAAHMDCLTSVHSNPPSI